MAEAKRKVAPEKQKNEEKKKKRPKSQTHRQLTPLEEVVGPLVASNPDVIRLVRKLGKATVYKFVEENGKRNPHAIPAFLRKLGLHTMFSHALDKHAKLNNGGKIVVLYPGCIETAWIDLLALSGVDIVGYREKLYKHDLSKGFRIQKPVLNDGDLFIWNDCPEIDMSMFKDFPNSFILCSEQIIYGDCGETYVTLPEYKKHEIKQKKVLVAGWLKRGAWTTVIPSETEISSYVEKRTVDRMFAGGVMKMKGFKLNIYPLSTIENRAILMLAHTDEAPRIGLYPPVGLLLDGQFSSNRIKTSLQTMEGVTQDSVGAVGAVKHAVSSSVRSHFKDSHMIKRDPSLQHNVFKSTYTQLSSTEGLAGAVPDVTTRDVVNDVKVQEESKRLELPSGIAEFLVDVRKKQGMVEFGAVLLKHFRRLLAWIKDMWKSFRTKDIEVKGLDFVRILSDLVLRHPAVGSRVSSARNKLIATMGKIGFVKNFMSYSASGKIMKAIDLALEILRGFFVALIEEKVKRLGGLVAAIFALTEMIVLMIDKASDSSVSNQELLIQGIIGIVRAVCHGVLLFIPFPLAVGIHTLVNFVASVTRKHSKLEALYDGLQEMFTIEGWDLIPLSVLTTADLPRISDHVPWIETEIPEEKAETLTENLTVRVNGTELDSKAILSLASSLREVPDRNALILVQSEHQFSRLQFGYPAFLDIYLKRYAQDPEPADPRAWKRTYDSFAHYVGFQGQLPSKDEIVLHINENLTGMKKANYLRAVDTVYDYPELIKDVAELAPTPKSNEMLCEKGYWSSGNYKGRFFTAMAPVETVLSMSLLFRFGAQFVEKLNRTTLFVTPGMGVTEFRGQNSVPVFWFVQKSSDSTEMSDYLNQRLSGEKAFVFMNSCDDTTLIMVNGDGDFYSKGYDLKSCDWNCSSASQAIFFAYLKNIYPNHHNLIERLRTQSKGWRRKMFKHGEIEIEADFFGNYTSSGEYLTAEKGKFLAWLAWMKSLHRFAIEDYEPGDTFDFTADYEHEAITYCAQAAHADLGFDLEAQSYECGLVLTNMLPPYLACSFVWSQAEHKVYIFPQTYAKALVMKSDLRGILPGSNDLEVTKNYCAARSCDTNLDVTRVGRAIKRMLRRVSGLTESECKQLASHVEDYQPFIRLQDTIGGEFSKEMPEVLEDQALYELEQKMDVQGLHVSYEAFIEELDSITSVHQFPFYTYNKYLLSTIGERYGVNHEDYTWNGAFTFNLPDCGIPMDIDNG